MQLTYEQNINDSHIGQLEGTRPYVMESYAAEGTVEFGRAVMAGTDVDKQVKIPTSAGQLFRGVSVSTWATEQNPNTGDGTYYAKDSVNVLRRGVVWVEVLDAVSTDEAAYFYTANGKFTSTNPQDNTVDQVPTGIFRSSADAGGLAKLEINLPVVGAQFSIIAADKFADGGGSATYAIPVTGMLLGDVVNVTLSATTNGVYLIDASAAAGQINVKLSGDPGVQTVNYTVFRAASVV